MAGQKDSRISLAAVANMHVQIDDVTVLARDFESACTL